MLGNVGDGVPFTHVAEEIRIGNVRIELRVGVGITQRNRDPVSAVRG